MVEGHLLVPATAIRDILPGVDQRGKMIVNIFEDYNADVKKLIGIDYSKSTWTKYDRTGCLWQYTSRSQHLLLHSNARQVKNRIVLTGLR